VFGSRRSSAGGCQFECDTGGWALSWPHVQHWHNRVGHLVGCVCQEARVANVLLCWLTAALGAVLQSGCQASKLLCCN
jgi:hypothetical protein